MAQSRKTPRRRVGPGLEALEGRQLLSGGHGKVYVPKLGQYVNDNDLRRYLRQQRNFIAPDDRRVIQKLDDGRTVAVTLYGPGTLDPDGAQVTTIDPKTGAVDIVFDDTDNTTRIIGAVHGGGRAARRRLVPVRSVRDADADPGTTGATGVNPLWAVVMPDFRLAENGYVNVTGGIVQLQFGAAGANAAMYLTEGTPPTSTSTNSTIVQGGASVGGITNVTAIETSSTTGDEAPGVEIRIDQIEGGALESPPLQDPALFAVDPDAGRLVRFRVDTISGQGQNATVDPDFPVVALPALADPTPAVALGRVGGRTLVLVGAGTQVLAYDASTGAAAGAFSTANLAAKGITAIDGIGSTATRTVLTGTGGNAVEIDLAASLANGQAEAVGVPLAPRRDLVLNGDATAVAGANVIYAGAAANFDTFTPDQLEFGLATLGVTNAGVAEQARTTLPGFVSAGPDGLAPNPAVGLGSLDTRIAQLYSAGGRNSLVLYTPTAATSTTAASFTPAGSVAVAYAGRLAGLSESFHPEIAGAVLINVQGNARRLVSQDVRGLVMNVTGDINLVAIHEARDVAVVGRPISQIDIRRRRNVQLLSTPRGDNGKETRGGVTLKPKLPPVGPLFLP